MFISSNFDSGNIEVISCEVAGDGVGEIQLHIRKDAHSEFYQWFHFRLSGARGIRCTLKILNAGAVAYPPGLENYRVCYSYDRDSWLRHPTQLEQGVLCFDFKPDHDSVYFAYFAPYSMERHHDLIAKSMQSPLCSHRLLGQSLDGQDLDLLRIALPDQNENKKTCWIIARQHPGESMAQWWMEGCIERLLDADDSDTQALLGRCTFYLVPNMNPDGSRRGHLRTNAAGRNLNREWIDPTMEASPEVYLVKQAMNETGMNLMLDVHGDESLPYCFIAGTEGLCSWNEKKQAQLDFYRTTLAELNPDFQTEKGYAPKQQGQANLTMSTVQMADLHSCLAMTLEMPFKDTTATADEKFGWSAQRSKLLAHSCLQAIQKYLVSGLL